ncbi:DDE-type integrase/transposase/recombinase [Cytobacillus kochii]|uniref:DDE-type integrase/transposase/recombinase n=1 Tax=Cytobacillus kochii TaxID=859143 RepID=UPI0027868B15|nr:DDE-type integrase/transposase/recombinase [Cytobacillus kochii]MDQ0186943.1 transposase InsO family protein [Cytobacillus kochii]
MLNELEFLSWCEQNKIIESTKQFINENIRFQQPARTVGVGNRSLSGKYPSLKMGRTIQWESGKVEGPAVLMMEYDENVLEFYDQPNKINMRYKINGKDRGSLYTPDFFVIRKNEAVWEEWKDEKDLEKISKKQPWKYIKDSDGNWRCPPGESFAKQYGLSFRVCTSNEINWNLHRNFVFLDTYLRKIDEFNISEQNFDKIKHIVFKNHGISLKDLITCSITDNFNVDDIYVSIIKELLYVDLKNNALAEPDKVKVYLHKEHAEMYDNIVRSQVDEFIISSPLIIEVGKEIYWDGCIWQVINVGNNSISLSSRERYNEIPKALFLRLTSEGKITFRSQVRKEIDDEAIVDILNTVDENDYKIANYRYRFVKAYLQGELKESVDPKIRTIRHWVSQFKQAEKIFGNGYIGLLPSSKSKGNRNKRINQNVVELMEKHIKENYETLIQKNRLSVYGSFKNDCEDRGYQAPSYVTFCAYVKKRPREVQITKRKGRRAGYQVKDFFWEIERTTPRHGDFPLNICHLDHTELDIELICSRTGKNLGRPYLSLLLDAFSRRVIAFNLSFEPPSYRACMMIFRDCVKRFNRLPQQLVVDNGKEFHSTYFETFLAMYEIESKRRPAAQPRYGSVLERIFGTTNTSFIHNLTGNTKIMKNVREVTKSVNPKSHAKWDIKHLSMALEEFFFNLYETIEHPALGKTPRKAFEDGMFSIGERKNQLILYDKLFEVLSLPSTKTGQAKIQPSMGIKVNYLYYWNDEFKNPQVENTKVKVRYDPFNVGIAYAYVNKVWIKCISEYYPLFKNITEKELKFLTTEIKKIKQTHSQNVTISAQRLAKFIDEIEGNEQYELLRAKSEETKNVINIFERVKEDNQIVKSAQVDTEAKSKRVLKKHENKMQGRESKEKLDKPRRDNLEEIENPLDFYEEF